MALSNVNAETLANINRTLVAAGSFGKSQSLSNYWVGALMAELLRQDKALTEAEDVHVMDATSQWVFSLRFDGDEVRLYVPTQANQLGVIGEVTIYYLNARTGELLPHGMVCDGPIYFDRGSQTPCGNRRRLEMRGKSTMTTFSPAQLQKLEGAIAQFIKKTERCGYVLQYSQGFTCQILKETLCYGQRGCAGIVTHPANTGLVGSVYRYDSSDLDGSDLLSW